MVKNCYWLNSTLLIFVRQRMIGSIHAFLNNEISIKVNHPESGIKISDESSSTTSQLVVIIKYND